MPIRLLCLVPLTGCATIRGAVGPTVDGEGRVGVQGMLGMGAGRFGEVRVKDPASRAPMGIMVTMLAGGVASREGAMFEGGIAVDWLREPRPVWPGIETTVSPAGLGLRAGLFALARGPKDDQHLVLGADVMVAPWVTWTGGVREDRWRAIGFQLAIEAVPDARDGGRVIGWAAFAVDLVSRMDL